MEQARELLTQFSGPGGYAIYFFIIVACGVGLPFNSDLTFITASVLSHLGYFQLSLLIPLGFLALLCGDSINFFIARKFGKKIIQIKPISWVIKPEKVAIAEGYLKRNGTRFIFVVRFLPLIRTVLYFTAGSLHVNISTFYLMDALSTLIYLPLLMGSAYLMSEHIERVILALKNFQFGLLFLIIFAGITFFLINKNKKAGHE